MIANTKNTIYESFPAVAGLNNIQGFDPRKFMRRTVSEQTNQEVLYLDLKYKKLWFRLACPKGRIKTTALKITEQIAIIEAKIFFDKNDKEPISSFIAQRNAKDTPGSLYIEAAQYAAVDQALFDAGFGPQFSDVSYGPDTELLDEGIPVPHIGKVQETVETGPTEQTTAPIRDIPPQTVVRSGSVQTDVVALEPQIQNPPIEPIVEKIIEQAPSPLITHAEAEQDPRVVQPPIPLTAPSQPPVPLTAPLQPETILAGISRPQAEPLEVPVQEIAEESDQGTSPYTADMPVDDIYRLMTFEEAESIIVDVGTCKGWTLGQVAQRRIASLKWYLNGYTGDNNLLRAGAKLLLEREQAKMAS